VDAQPTWWWPWPELLPPSPAGAASPVASARSGVAVAGSAAAPAAPALLPEVGDARVVVAVVVAVLTPTDALCCPPGPPGVHGAVALLVPSLWCAMLSILATLLRTSPRLSLSERKLASTLRDRRSVKSRWDEDGGAAPLPPLLLAEAEVAELPSPVGDVGDASWNALYAPVMEVVAVWPVPVPAARQASSPNLGDRAAPPTARENWVRCVKALEGPRGMRNRPRRIGMGRRGRTAARS
jgi:hypothetical protein